MAWDTAVDTNTPTIRREYRKFKEKMSLAIVRKKTDSDSAETVPIGVQVRSRTIITDERPGVTQTAAQAYADTKIGDTNVVDAHIERMNDGGAYKSVFTTDSAGAWGVP
jgi:hypothetical protein